MNKVDFKSKSLTPTVEDVVADQLANIINTLCFAYEDFKSKVILNSRQADVFSAYYSAPDVLQTFLLYGSTGSAKTWLSLLLLVDIMMRNPGASVLITRNSYPEIEDSLMPDIAKMMEMYNIQYTIRMRPVPVVYLPNVGGKMLFRATSKSASMKAGQDKADSLGSLQISAAYMNEADNQDYHYYKTLPARMRQLGIVSKPLLLLDCNPPPTDHWIYNEFFKKNDGDDPTSNIRAFHLHVQDNVRNVGQQYIDNLKMAYKDNPSLYLKFIEGKFGPSVRGTAIFGGAFDRGLHVSYEPIRYDPNYPVIRGWDFGYNRPACVFLQYLVDINRINVLRCTSDTTILFHDFVDRVLNQSMLNFPGAVFKDYCDPAGRHKSAHSGKSDIDILKDYGIIAHSQFTNISYGLGIIFETLNTLCEKDKRPVLQLDPVNAVPLIDALAMGYTQDVSVRNIGQNKDIKPCKDGYYDHYVDAFRYIIVNIIKGLGKKYTRPQPQLRERFGWRNIEDRYSNLGLRKKNTGTPKYNF